MSPTVVQLVSTVLAQLSDLGQRSSGPSAVEPSYFELFERHSRVLYPAIGILVIVLLVAGIFQAWRTQDMDALDKVEFKREILTQLRQTIGGATAEMLGKAVGLEPFKAVKLLEELQRDGIVISHTNTSRLTLWRIKGVGSIPTEL